MKRLKAPLAVAVAIIIGLTACGADDDGIPDPTDGDRAELAAKAAAYPQGYCVLAWEDDGEYDVECYPNGVSAVYSERSWFAGPVGYVFPVMLPRPVEYKASKPKTVTKDSTQKAPAKPAPAKPAAPAPRVKTGK